MRPFSRLEFWQIHNEFAQKEASDGEFLLNLWDKGAHAIRVSGEEMNTMVSMVDNENICDSLVLETTEGRENTLY